MKNTNILNVRISDDLQSDLEAYCQAMDIQKSDLLRDLIEKKLYNDDDILSNSDTIPKDSPFYSTDFLRLLLMLYASHTVSKAHLPNTVLWRSIIIKNFEKTDDELKQILIPVAEDMERLVNEIEENPDVRHYYLFEVDRDALTLYIREHINLCSH